MYRRSMASYRKGSLTIEKGRREKMRDEKGADKPRKTQKVGKAVAIVCVNVNRQTSKQTQQGIQA